MDQNAPLRRTVPLRRKVPMRRKELSSRSSPEGRAKRKTTASRAVKNLVWARAQNRCERCGRDLTYSSNYSIHHRHPRGMGGCQEPWINELPNLVLLCGSGVTGCHGDVHGEVAQAYADGWLVPTGARPERVPIVRYDGRRVLLLPE